MRVGEIITNIAAEPGKARRAIGTEVARITRSDVSGHLTGQDFLIGPYVPKKEDLTSTLDRDEQQAEQEIANVMAEAQLAVDALTKVREKRLEADLYLLSRAIPVGALVGIILMLNGMTFGIPVALVIPAFYLMRKNGQQTQDVLALHIAERKATLSAAPTRLEDARKELQKRNQPVVVKNTPSLQDRLHQIQHIVAPVITGAMRPLHRIRDRFRRKTAPPTP